MSENTGYTEGNDAHTPDPTAMSGTLDTSGVGGGVHSRVEHVSAVFDPEHKVTGYDPETETAVVALDDEAHLARIQESADADADAYARKQEQQDYQQEPAPEGTLERSFVPGVTEEDAKAKAIADGTTVDTTGTSGGVSSEAVVGAESTEFEPADHTVEEVRAYLATADDTETKRVLEAEGEGKDRAGVHNAPEAQVAYDPADYTLADVKAHLEEVDETERERILAAEREGKNRAGLVG
jgi:hypothetical protein